MIRTVVFGKSNLSIQITKFFQTSKDHKLLGVVPCPQTSPVFSSLATFANENDIPIFGLEDLTPEMRVDLGFSCYFSKIFRPQHIRAVSRLLNLHNSPLPKYRGMRPINWALVNGESGHGVTIHEINEGIDTGPIVAQCTFPIFLDDEVIDVYLRAQAFGWQLFMSTAHRLHDLPSVAQEEMRATTYRGVDESSLGDRATFTRSGDMRNYKLPL